MTEVFANKTDKKGYNKYYKGAMFYNGTSKDEFYQEFETQIKPYCKGGITKGYVRGLSVDLLISAADVSGKKF